MDETRPSRGHRVAGAAALLTALLAPAVHAEEPAEAPRLRYEVGLLAGTKADATTFHGGRWGDTAGLAGVEFAGAYGALALEGSLHAVGTFAALGVRPGYAGVLRAGYGSEALAVRAGVVAQLTDSIGPQLLPSLHAGWRSGRFGLSAGLFDGLGYVPAHLSVHWDDYSLGVVPLGARAGARFNLGESLALKVEGFAFALGSYQSALLTVSALFGSGAAASAEAP